MANGITATVQQQYGRVRLELTFTSVTSATVSRVHADGTVWPVRGGSPATVNSTTGVGWVGYDHEAPLDQQVTYRAVNGATTLTSTAVTVASSAADLRSRVWLTHPLKPGLSVQALITNVGARTRKGRSSALPIVGSADPVALTDTRLSPTGDLGVFTATLAEAAAMEALLADGTVLCVRAPASWGSMWFYALIGDPQDAPAAGHALDPSRDWVLPYTAVASTAGTSAGPVGVTYADVNATYATYALLTAGNTTWVNANPFFEVDLSDWTAQSGATLARVNTFAHEGSWSMRITPPGAVATVGARTTTLYPTTPGKTYTASAWLYAAGGWSDARACIDWYDSAGVFMNTGLGSPTVLPSGVWTLSSQNLVCPDGATQGAARVRIGGTPAAGNVVHGDEVKIVELYTYNSILTGP